MTNKDFIESGILEQYVAGTASIAEQQEVEERAATDPTIREEIDAGNHFFVQYIRYYYE